MALLTVPPTTEALSKAAGEDVGKRFEVRIGKNRNADFVVLRDRINVYLESSERPRSSAPVWQFTFWSLVAGG